MKRYEHGGNTDPEQIRYDFSANINPLGMPTAVRQAVIQSADDCIRYPDPQCLALGKALAGEHGVSPQQIVCGNGAADLIYRLAAALRPKKALLSAPTFSEYEKALAENGCGIRFIELKEAEDFRYPDTLPDAVTNDIDLVMLCSPNNPTGTTIAPALLEKLVLRCIKLGIALAVDECFLPFVNGEMEKSMVPYLKKYPGNGLYVLRAFTKLYAMPGLRLGYLICGSAEQAQAVRNRGQSWSVSVPAQAAGLAALKEAGYAAGTAEYVERQRAYLSGELDRLGLKVYPAEANFLLFRHMQAPEWRAKGMLSFADRMQRHGIAVRRCENFRGLGPDYYRIAVRTEEENREFIRQTEWILQDPGY